MNAADTNSDSTLRDQRPVSPAYDPRDPDAFVAYCNRLMRVGAIIAGTYIAVFTLLLLLPTIIRNL